jgi:hypothetical protein
VNGTYVELAGSTMPAFHLTGRNRRAHMSSAESRASLKKLRALRAQLLLIDNVIRNALPWRHDTTLRRHATSRSELVDDTDANRNLAARGRR